VNDYRDRQRRNFLGSLLLSAGVPMILGGDEIARSQGGNNNAYCQDDEISWFDWAAADQDLLAFTTAAIAFRKEHASLRPEWYRTAPGDSESTVSVLRADAAPFEEGDWADAGNRAVILVLDQGDDAVAVLLNASDTTVEFTLPEHPNGGTWSLGLSSDPDQQVTADATTVLVRDASFTALQ
jgi:isoamylase